MAYTMKGGNGGLSKKKKNGDIRLGLKPPTLLDLVKMFFLPSLICIICIIICNRFVNFLSHKGETFNLPIYWSLSAGWGKGRIFVYLKKKLWLSIQPIDCFNLDFLFI